MCAVFFYALGGVPLLGPDEPRYAEVAREMSARGDWVTPTLAGRVWFEKPALLYWLMIAGFRVLGVTEFAARAGSAAAGVLTIFITGWIARRAEFESGESLRGFGIACACVMGSTLGLIVFSRAASFDVLLTATVTAALACFYFSEVERDARRRRLLLAGFYACVGLSLLAKGLVGIVVPAGVVVCYFLLRRRWPGLSRVGIFWGVPLMLGVACVWYAPVIARHGWTFVNQFFVEQHFARYVSNKYHHPQPFYFYVPIILMLALPWTFFLAGGLSAQREVNPRADDAATKLRVLALAWLAVPVLFFSASGSKLPGYVLPALPGAALLAGVALHKYLRGAGGFLAMRLTGALALAFCLAAWIYAYRLYTPKPGVEVDGVFPLVTLLAVTIPALLCGAVALLAARRRALCFVSVVLATFLTVLMIVAFALDDFARNETVAYMLAKADRRGYGDAPVVQLHTVERTAEFYAAGRLAYAADGEPLKFEGARDVAEFARGNGGRALVIVPKEYVSQLSKERGLESAVVGWNRMFALVFVQASP